MTPSDPDFPFDIDALDCVLVVPSSYPGNDKPRIRFLNKEMGRGYQINVENGFANIVDQYPGNTLLQYLNRLDKHLEVLLATPKADTVKLVANLSKPTIPVHSHAARPETAPTASSSIQPTDKPVPQQATVSFSDEQKAKAANKKEAELRQLEARLGRLPLFSKYRNGTSFTIPVEPRSQNDLPTELQALKTVKLTVPLLYNLEPCSITVVGTSGPHSSNVERAFLDRATSFSEQSLFNHINYLSQNMHKMAMQFPPPPPSAASATTGDLPSDLNRAEEPVADSRQPAESNSSALKNEALDRSHIVTIPRPPEWDIEGDDSDDESEYSTGYDTGDESDEAAISGEDTVAGPAGATPERGVMLSFPFLELHSIELLELVTLNIS
ncbi:hypothetical protein LTS18_006803, partial [Coniosporium uncinatum]